MRKAKQTLQAEFNEVERLLRTGMEDKEIMNMLRMPRNAFYATKKRIYKQEAIVFKQQTLDDIAFKTTVLHTRLTNLYNLVERKLALSVKTEKGEQNPSKDFANTAAIAQDIAVNIYKLETQGIQSLNGRLYGSIRRIEERENDGVLQLPDPSDEPE